MLRNRFAREYTIKRCTTATRHARGMRYVVSSVDHLPRLIHLCRFENARSSEALAALSFRRQRRFRSFDGQTALEVRQSSEQMQYEPPRRAGRVDTLSTRCGIERPSLSRRGTSSISPGRSAFRHVCKPSRSSMERESTSSKTFAHPAARRASSCGRVVWSEVETRAYPIRRGIAPVRGVVLMLASGNKVSATSQAFHRAK